ncbi:MAG: hypothetical protein RMI34_12760 [Chloroherpetonaceae bacterium]|nr:hypothetical protein [Chloroherpetonaceae bacterium]MCS7210664.1 hypothetical protein [Chloroherpetonaceae bacterium]MDW8020929.1 hypothetical protein [Chloroherpetonaceae bacterium]
MTRGILASLVLLCLSTIAVHNFHVSYGKMAIEDNIAVLNLRFFKDDLELALQKFHRLESFSLSATPTCDSLFLAYLNSRFELRQPHNRLLPQLVTSGIDKDMWWYQLQFSSSTPIEQLSIKNTLLFEVFDDQKNILQVMHFPSEKLQSFYFIHGAEQYDFSCP